jgi:RNA polymerase subunit RPABC4/transcription elongation factor Spt4
MLQEPRNELIQMALIACSECGNEVSERAAACPQCGNPIASEPPMALIACNECGNEISERAETCPQCGNPIASERPKSTPGPSLKPGDRPRLKGSVRAALLRPRALLVIAGALVLLIVAAVLASSLNRGSEHTITGTFTVYDEFNGCDLSEGYSDISEGTQVVVTDENGKTLGVGALGEPVEADADEEGDIFGCEFPFEVTGVPDSSIYGISVAERGTSQSKKEELEGSDWKVELTLGL